MALTRRMQDMLKALRGGHKVHWTLSGLWTVPGADDLYHSITVFRLMWSNLAEWVPGKPRFARLTDKGEILAKALHGLKEYP